MQGGSKGFKEKTVESQTRKRAAKVTDLNKTPLFKGAEHLTSRFVGIDESSEKKGKNVYKSYICELKQNQQLKLTEDGVEYLYLILKGHLRLLLPSSFQHNKLGVTYFVAWRGKGQILGETKPLCGLE